MYLQKSRFKTGLKNGCRTQCQSFLSRHLIIIIIFLSSNNFCIIVRWLKYARNELSHHFEAEEIKIYWLNQKKWEDNIKQLQKRAMLKKC